MLNRAPPAPFIELKMKTGFGTEDECSTQGVEPMSHAIEPGLLHPAAGAKPRPESTAVLAVTSFVGVILPAPSCAFDVDLFSAGIRWGVDNERVLGDEQPEAFREYDVWATFAGWSSPA